MDITQIKGIGKELNTFLSQFDDCFSRSGSRQNLHAYVNGQLSDLPRKSIEPIALAANIPPRTLQCFLSILAWDHQRIRDKIQWIVAAEHAHPSAIGVVDDSGNPKKGVHTAGVQWQWCGNSGKTDNCVVGVHIAYVAGDFQCILDSDVYLPKDWAQDTVRRKRTHIPDEVIYRKKTDIALEQISRSMQNGIRVFAWTFDEWYGRDGDFLDGLETRGQNYVGEVPSDFSGWLYEPEILAGPTAHQRHKRGRRRHFPRLARKALPASELRNLLVYSRMFQNQKWEKFHVKDSENGPIVWEVKHARFYRKQGLDGLPGPAHYLIVARNVLNHEEVKYFVSNMVPGLNGVTLEKLLWVAFSRFPIERCFEVGKRELGMDHFEVRKFRSIQRRLFLSCLSHVFLSEFCLKYRREKFGVDGMPGSHCRSAALSDLVSRGALFPKTGRIDCGATGVNTTAKSQNCSQPSTSYNKTITYDRHKIEKHTQMSLESLVAL